MFGRFQKDTMSLNLTWNGLFLIVSDKLSITIVGSF